MAKNITIAVLVAVIIGLVIYLSVSKKSEVKLVPPTEQTQNVEVSTTPTDPVVAQTYTYKDHGFTMELPVGYVPQKVTGETGPTISIELPKGWLVYVTNATWWEQNNLVGQATLLRTEKIGNTTFSVYKYDGQAEEFYWFRQGNVAYVFTSGAQEYMKTFKFVGWAQ